MCEEHTYLHSAGADKLMKDKSTVNKIQGCLLGGAVGDALGYAVEFLQEETIFEKYGPNGITGYDTGVFEKALISDDTQMSLFTAAGLLLAQDRMVPFEKSDAFVQCISDAYSDWLMTQTEEYVSNKAGINTWLATIPEMYNWRSPGGSCLSGAAAGRRGVLGRIESPLNFSKGCGGVMRVAPIGLFFDSAKVSLADIDMLGARAAVLTHGHPLGYIPASAMVHIVHCVTYEDMELCDAVESALILIPYLFPKSQYMEEFLSIMRKAIQLATYEIDDLDAIHELGAGRCGEDNLAIAVYCALKHSDDFESAIVAAVNHSGDSDSTGAVTGNIMGAYLGTDAIPEKYLKKLELRDVIIQIADELSMGYSLDL